MTPFFINFSHFHITQNMYCDVMHDMLEGICRYVIIKVLKSLIMTDKLFNLNTMNYRIQFFDYGNSRASNSVPPISETALKKEYLICSASEMKQLLEYLGFMIGDLVPKDNKTWEIYITLRKIQCLLVKIHITEQNIELLQTLIAQHHRLYQQLFNEPLKPSLHFLTHYPTVIRNNGPIYAVSCMRMEGKHKEYKELAQVIRSRKNICYSLAMRNQLNFAERLQAKKGFHDRLNFGPSVAIKLDQLPSYDALRSIITESHITEYKNTVSWAQVNGTCYKLNMVLVIEDDKGSTKFGKIVHILISNICQVAFICLKLRTTHFDEHIHGFAMEETSEWCMKIYKNLDEYKPRNVHTLADGKRYIPC